MQTQGNVTPLKPNNSTVVNTNDSAIDDISDKEF